LSDPVHLDGDAGSNVTSRGHHRRATLLDAPSNTPNTALLTAATAASAPTAGRGHPRKSAVNVAPFVACYGVHPILTGAIGAISSTTFILAATKPFLIFHFFLNPFLIVVQTFLTVVQTFLVVVLAVLIFAGESPKRSEAHPHDLLNCSEGRCGWS
jgi:hypothetical protein